MAEPIVSFGAWVRLRRQALVLSREELASRVGVAEVTIRKVEADERRPSPQVAALLAEQLQLAPAERETFVRVARGVLAVAHLPPPIPGQAAPAPATPTSQAAAPLPAGTVTFLFTDIEGSTRLWEREPQAMRQALARHDAILRETIASNGGQVFKTVGDAFYAAFAEAPAALVAALDAQRALAAEAWPTSAPLRVRMALHSGTAQPHGGDYFGLPLNRVARLLSVGHGGQVLLSLAAHELVRDHLPPEARLIDLGSHQLRDLSQPEAIFQLAAPELPSSFPPLRTLSQRPGNLPPQLTELIGREQEIAELSAHLSGETRLVTLTGPGGTGKTRLALALAAAVAERFPDGAWFVDLSPVSDPEQSASAIAQALGIRETADQPVQETVRSWLSARKLLLILDNCEQVIDGVSHLAASLLRAADDLTILATSRIPLRLLAEREYAVEPLGLPSSTELPPLEQLSQYDAVSLFIARARAVRRDFSLTNANAPAVAEICVRLDGLPLALELAAARIRMFPPEQLLGRLISARLQTLAGGARDLPTRQQTIRAAIGWSERLLTPEQRTLLARLGVFVGGWTLEDAEAVCGDEGLDVPSGLEALVESSLVRAQEREDAARYTMLETIREYAREQLEGRGETEALQRRHATHFLELAEAMDAQMQWAGQRAWLDRVEAEYDNVRAALAWELGGADAELGIRLVSALDGQALNNGFWMARGYWSDQHRWFDAAYSRSSAVAPRARAMLFLQMSTSEWGWFDDDAERDVLYWEALAIFRREGDTSDLAHALYRGGHRFWHRGEPDLKQGAALLEESLALYRSLNDSLGIATATWGLGGITFHQNELARAGVLLGETVARFRELGVNEVKLGIALHGLGEVSMMQGDTARASALFWEAVMLIHSVSDHWMILWPLRNLCCLALVEGGDERLLATLEEQVQWQHDGQMSDGLVFLLQFLAALVYRQGDTRRALDLISEVLPIQLAGRDYLVKETLDVCALIAVGQGQGAQAARFLNSVELLQAQYRPFDFPSWRIAHPQLVAKIRAQVDEATFAATWGEERTITLEQAVDEALAWVHTAQSSPV